MSAAFSVTRDQGEILFRLRRGRTSHPDQEEAGLQILELRQPSGIHAVVTVDL
jgi:hypothetical protein